jgi:DNA-directed RNA polymerase subunit RPC12/RpoP
MMFSKKSEQHKPSPEFLQLVERWEVFLKKMETRFFDLLEQAEEAVMDNLVERDFDLNPTTRAWQSMKSQLHMVIDKIHDTFDSKVRPSMEKYDKQYRFAIEESVKGDRLREQLFHKLDRYEIELEGRLAQRFYDHAITFQNESFNCSQCGAKLEISKDIFRSHYVACSFCNTINTFKPNSKLLNIQWSVVDNIAKHHCLAEWDAMSAAYAHYHSLRDDREAQIAAIKQIESKTRAYWEKYLKERICLISEYKESYKQDLKAKMNSFAQWKETQTIK